eukprot:4589913-Prymnesium_polylepis.1
MPAATGIAVDCQLVPRNGIPRQQDSQRGRRPRLSPATTGAAAQAGTPSRGDQAGRRIHRRRLSTGGEAGQSDEARRAFEAQPGIGRDFAQAIQCVPRQDTDYFWGIY